MVQSRPMVFPSIQRGNGLSRRWQSCFRMPKTFHRKHFPTKKVKLFYKLIEKYGFKDAHITDLVKCRRKAKEPMDKMIQNCLHFLEQEIEILKPKLIVAVGKKVKRILEKKFANKEIEIVYITHYAYRGKDRNKRLRKDFRRLREKYYITLE